MLDGSTGVCWDNATAESICSTFKNEYYHRQTFATINAAGRGSYAWIDVQDNACRYTGIGCFSPLVYEYRQRALAA